MLSCPPSDTDTQLVGSGDIVVGGRGTGNMIFSHRQVEKKAD